MSNFKVQKSHFEQLENREMKTGGLFAFEMPAQEQYVQPRSVEVYQSSQPVQSYAAQASYGAAPELNINYGGYGGMSLSEALNGNLGNNLLAGIGEYEQYLNSPQALINDANQLNSEGLLYNPLTTTYLQGEIGVEQQFGESLVDNYDSWS